MPLPLPMVRVGNAHPVAFRAPFYASAAGAGARLHRYQDTEFIPRFLTDLAALRLTDPTAEDWWRSDRFSPHGDEPVLRLPIHRTFYLVTCELVCERPPNPALDPQRIRSAGFVIRRRVGAAPLPTTGGRRDAGVLAGLRARLAPEPSRCPGAGATAVLTAQPAAFALASNPVGGLTLASPAGFDARWMLEDGEPLGWQRMATAASAAEPDPDPRRRPVVRRAGAATARAPAVPTAYTGEETYPLHPVLVRDASGRPHTILYGFLPLGGQSLSLGNPFAPADEQATLAAGRAALTWPFGYRGRASQQWQEADAVQVTDGQPTPAFFELLELLVNRYHLGEAPAAGADPLNDALSEAAAGLQFAELSFGQAQSLFGLPLTIPIELPRFTLRDYLSACFAAGVDNPIAAWLAARRQAIDAAGGTPDAALLGRLPRRPADGAGDLAGLTLRLTCAGAEDWRLLLGQRLLDQVRRTGAELPIPKFRQGADDLYQVIPFVRASDAGGCERLTWGGPAMRSAPFRVAAPFDPDASRPVLIQMPGLGDLKRGLARGAAMLVPPDTAGLLATLKLDKGAGPDLAGEPPAGGDGGLDVQWLCSFSLPIITLVAMILLMIMVIILNLLFFWLPWVKICLPFPKLK